MSLISWTDKAKQDKRTRADLYNSEAGADPDSCPRCKGKGLIAKMIDGNMRYFDCVCRERETIAKRAENAGLRPRAERFTFDSFRTEEPWAAEMKEIAMGYAREPKNWLLLSGQSGCGKTHLCTAVTMALLEQDYQVRYMSWREEVGDLKSLTMDREARRKRLDELRKCQVLYIDDFLQSCTGISDADLNVAFEILDYRYQAKKLTILSTELRLAIITSASQALGSRISELTENRRYLCQKNTKANRRLYRA